MKLILYMCLCFLLLTKISHGDIAILRGDSRPASSSISHKLIQEMYTKGTSNTPQECKCSESVVANLIKGMPELRGPPGEIGLIGEPGYPGIKGEKGSQGESGNWGQKGEKGDIGPPGFGDIGVPGLCKGIKGDKGSQGESGNWGQKGEKGDIGPPGFRDIGVPGVCKDGVKGEKGDPGAPGSTRTLVNGDESYTGEFVIYKSMEVFRRRAENVRMGTLAFVLQEKKLLLRVDGGWEYFLWNTAPYQV